MFLTKKWRLTEKRGEHFQFIKSTNCRKTCDNQICENDNSFWALFLFALWTSYNNLCFIARQIEGFNDYDFRIAECTGRCLLILRRIEIALQYLLWGYYTSRLFGIPSQWHCILLPTHYVSFKTNDCFNWSLIIDHWSLIIDHWSLIIDNWQLKIDNWQLTVDNWQLIIDNYSYPYPGIDPNSCSLWGYFTANWL